MSRPFIIALALALLGATTDDPGASAVASWRPADGVQSQVVGSLSMGKLGEDGVMELQLATSIIHRKWQLAPRLPLRLRAVDASPDHSKILRMEDWDTLSDFGRLLPMAQYGHPDESLFLRYGELSGLTLGNGTFIYRYHNNVRLDDWQGGLYAKADGGLAGAEAMVDDVLSPSLAVIRPFLRPLASLPAMPAFLRHLRVGVTAGADFLAPSDLQVAQTGDPEAGHFVSRSRATDVLMLLGADLSLPLWNSQAWRLTSYIDVNSLDLAGIGFHAGVHTEIALGDAGKLFAKAEFFQAGRGYHARYVSPFYDIERRSHLPAADVVGGPPDPKLSWLRNAGQQAPHSGYALDGELRLQGGTHLMVGFSHGTSGSSSTLLLRAKLPEWHGLHTQFSYARMGIESAADLFQTDDTVFAAAARYQLGSHLFLSARLVNEWWLNQEPSRAKAFETVLNYDLGIGAAFRL